MFYTIYFVSFYFGIYFLAGLGFGGCMGFFPAMRMGAALPVVSGLLAEVASLAANPGSGAHRLQRLQLPGSRARAP